LRLGSGGSMFFGHGLPKLIKFSAFASTFPDILGFGPTVSLSLCVFAEFFCAFAIMLGLLTRWSAVPLVINMLVAAFVVQAADPWAKKELAVVYLIPYVTLIFTGGGGYSLDSILLKKN